MSSIVEFGEWRLSLSERRLEWRGRPVKLGSRALDLLIALTLRKGEVVPSNDLMRHAWPRTVVTDASLRLHIWELRKALAGHSPEAGNLVINIPGRGYLLADVPPASGQVAAVPAARLPLAKGVPPYGRVFGRDAVVQQILQLMASQPIVTLVAPGGMGKTTVAQEVLLAGTDFGTGPIWVDLSSVRSEGLVAEEVARCAGVTRPGDPAMGLIDLLGTRTNQLLVLDCCERVIGGATSLAESLVQQVPGVRILATSREALHADGECVVRLPPLEIGPADSADSSTWGSAAELFIERAHAADLPLALPRDLPAVVEICRALDGLPLAIELAAAHLVGFSIRDLATLISSGFELGNLGRRTASERHRTLEATFEWSYGLLDGSDRHSLEWLSIFEGGASLQAILEVLAGTEQDAEQISGALVRLVDKSLVKLVPHEGGSFYRLLDTARAFAAKRLQDRGELISAHVAHARYMLRAVSASQVEGQGSWAVEWFGPRAPNLANLRAALAWTRPEPSVRSLAIALSAAAAPTFLQLSLLAECESNCALALRLLPPSGGAPDEGVTRLMAYQGGAMLGTRGPVDETLEVINAARARADEARDPSSRALALSGLFWLWIYRNNPQEASRSAVALYEAGTRDPASALLRDQSLAYASTLLGDQEDALARLKDVQQRNLRLSHGKFMRIGSDPNVFSRVFLVKTHWLRGEMGLARELYEGNLPSLRKPEHGLYYCWALNEVMIPMHCFWGEWSAARAAADELADAATRQTMAVRQHAAKCASMAIDLLQGGGDLSTYMEAVDALRRGHFASLLPWFDGVAAEAAFRRGDAPLALRLMDRAIAGAAETGSRWWLPELHRIHGMALATSQDLADLERASDQFRRACEIARSQHAHALRLSAAVSWSLTMPPGMDQEGRRHLREALAGAPEMADQPLALQAGHFLRSDDAPSDVPTDSQRQVGRRRKAPRTGRT
jgi:predicted ATPase